MAVRLLTVDEVAERLRVNAETVRRWLRLGKLKGAHLPNKAGWRIREDDLDSFVDGYMNTNVKPPNEVRKPLRNEESGKAKRGDWNHGDEQQQTLTVGRYVR